MMPCVIVAGGRSSRMGGEDKCLLPLAGEPLLAHVMARIATQTSAILINSNSDVAKFRNFGAPVARDIVDGFKGPLAGILTGMLWAHENCGATHILSVPCDTPYLPLDLASRLKMAMRRTGADIAIARDEQRSHPVIGLWPLSLADTLAKDLANGTRAIHSWLVQFHVCEVGFATGQFQNINTHAQLLEADGKSAVSLKWPAEKQPQLGGPQSRYFSG
jgi:molybdenum cofactor guanylyltransferase